MPSTPLVNTSRPARQLLYFLPSCAATYHDEFWHVGRVSQEGAEKAHGAQLHRETKPVVLPATNIDQLSVGGIEVEVAVQLSPGGNPLAVGINPSHTAGPLGRRRRPAVAGLRD